jgi:hypothetical protein
MQTELERWIEEHSFYRRLSRGGERLKYGDVVAVEDLRAMLAGKVLCNAEPVAWQTPQGFLFTARKEAAIYSDEGVEERPFYAPASPMGNASLAGNADIGSFDEGAERAAFEAWSKDTFIHFTDDSGVYELADTRNAWTAWLARARLADIGTEAQQPDYKALHDELLYQVATVVPGESRYQTALRYIREREDRCNTPEVGESTDIGKEGGE